LTKKEKLIEVATKEFARSGFHAVSTAKISKLAGVSAGLIFKHFKNKQGLFQVVFERGMIKSSEMFFSAMKAETSEKLIEEAIDMIFKIKEEEYDFWRLIFKLKWDENFYRPEEVRPFIDRIAWALKKLGWSNPKMEAELFYQTIESTSISILRDGRNKNLKYRKYLKEKYLTKKA